MAKPNNIKAKAKNYKNPKKKFSLTKFQKKKAKLSLVFDDTARVEFITGFHKRKLQRKAIQKTKLEKQLAAERLRIRAEAKKSVGKLSSSHSILPEVENLLRITSTDLEPQESTSKSFTIGNKVVTVSSLENIHMKLPPIEPNAEESSPEPDNDLEEDEDAESSKYGTNMKSMLKKATNRLLQNSKAYKTSQRIKHKNKKGRKNPNFVAKRDRNSKGADDSSSKGSSTAKTFSTKGKNKVTKKKRKGQK